MNNLLGVISEDFEGDLLKEHVDGIITYQRLMNAGIKFVTFDQTYLMAAINKNAIGMKVIEKIKMELDQKSRLQDKKKLFDIFLMNKMEFLTNNSSPRPMESLNKLLADFVSYCETSNLDDENWINNQKRYLDEDTLRDAYKFIRSLSRKFGIKSSITKRAKTKLKVR